MESFLQNKIYPHLPVALQNLAFSVYGYAWKHRRFGGDFIDELKGFESRERFTVEQWYEFQQMELRKLLLHAHKNVAYYTEVFRSIGLTEYDIAKFELKDLPKIPMLSKDTLRKYGTTTLVAKSPSKGHKFFTSSGSTGTPVKILFSYKTDQKWQAAYERRCRNWAGVNRNDSRAMIGGRKIVFGNPAKPPFHRVNFAENQIYLSIYHLSKQNFKWYYHALKEHAPVYLVGYSASISLLARNMLDLGLPPIKLKAVIGSSEKLTDSMKAVISKAFDCPVYDSWSGIEACALVTEHRDGNLYESPDAGIIEFLDRHHKPVDYGTEGEMICTGLINYDQPLIRYRIGDLAVPLAPNTGMNEIQMPKIKEIVGRTDDIITLRDGRQLSSFNRFFAEIDGIKEVQVIQIDLDHFQLNLVTEVNGDKEVKEKVLASIQSRLGKVHVDFRELPEIKRMANGKFRAVISHVKRNES